MVANSTAQKLSAPPVRRSTTTTASSLSHCPNGGPHWTCLLRHRMRQGIPAGAVSPRRPRVRQGRAAQNVHTSNTCQTGLGARLTILYLGGLDFRPARQVARMGIDSIMVISLYALALVGPIALAGAGS